MKKKTILVPTDFSNNALVATRYAIELAKKIEASIHILHAYRPFTSAFQSTSANEGDEKRAKLDAEKGLVGFLEKLDRGSEISVTSSLIKNGLLEAIINYIAENDVFLVVMGTHGASGTRKDLLGSNTYDVAKTVPCPLLVVPEHTNSFQLERVVFFSDYQHGDIQSLRSFDNLFGKLTLSCTLVHIHEKSAEPKESDQQKLVEWKTRLENETAYKNLTTELARASENVDSVQKILQQLHADMTLITRNDSRNFFQKSLKKSLARAIILNPHTPVLLTSGSAGSASV